MGLTILTGSIPLKTENVNHTKIVLDKIIDSVYTTKLDAKNYSDTANFILDRLPDWVLKSNVLNGISLLNKYKIDKRLNPLYHEADFNGDGNLDVALSIEQINTGKKGFAIIHGVTKEIYILGAGLKIKNGLSDDMGYVDIWKINRKKINEPGLEENTGTGEKGELILDLPSLQIEKSDLGGGQIYWDGKTYAYFHQTC
ncbi:hypothetical protein KFE94_08750 [bacterium SCSIO 12643]|nr:hypothetical protein KFE94_08750 [bacterium SCSIO 12643]